MEPGQRASVPRNLTTRYVRRSKNKLYEDRQVGMVTVFGCDFMEQETQIIGHTITLVTE